MATAQYFDNYSSTLASGYTSGGVSLIVTSATLLPSVGNFELTVDRGLASEEQFLCTARSGTTCTVVGAQGNTSASNHSAGATVDGAILGTTTMNQIRTDQNRVLTIAQFDALASTEYRNGDVIHLADTGYRVVRSNGSWTYFLGENKVTRPSTLSYTWDNQSSATIDTTYGTAFIDSVISHGSAHNWNIRYTPIPSPANPYTFICIFKVNFVPVIAVNQLNNRAGMGIYDSATGKFIALDTAMNGGYEYNNILSWTNTTTYGGSTYFSDIFEYGTSYARGYQYYKIVNDGTNVTYYVSFNNGRSLKQLFQHTKNTFVTPTSVFFGVSAYSGIMQIEAVDITITQP